MVGFVRHRSKAMLLFSLSQNQRYAIDARELRDNRRRCLHHWCRPAGISIARWINTKHKVILLEGGGFEYDEKVQQLYDAKQQGSILSIAISMTTLLWWHGPLGGIFVPLLIRIEKRDWMPHGGWPIKKRTGIHCGL
jgi:hypothetical protein